MSSRSTNAQRAYNTEYSGEGSRTDYARQGSSEEERRRRREREASKNGTLPSSSRSRNEDASRYYASPSHRERPRENDTSRHGGSLRNMGRSTPSHRAHGSGGSYGIRDDRGTPSQVQPPHQQQEQSWSEWFGAVTGIGSKTESTPSPPSNNFATPKTPGSGRQAQKSGNAPEPQPQEEGVWGVWNRIKVAAVNLTVKKEEDEVDKALTEYYAQKGEPVPAFLVEKSRVPPGDEELERFERRLNRSGGPQPSSRSRDVRGQLPHPQSEPSRRRRAPPERGDSTRAPSSHSRR